METHSTPPLNIEYLPIDALRPDPKNPRKHSPQQIKALSRAIAELGFNNPVLIDRQNIVIAGHCRLEAARLQALTTIPAIRLEHLSPAQVKAYRIADNRIAELAEWDMDALKLELQTLSDLDLNFDLTLTGFETPKLDLMLNPIVQELCKEENIPLPDESIPVTQAGDIWILGKHRVSCGDSLKPATYDLLLDGQKAHVVFTDPPYNVPINGHVLTGDQHGHSEFTMANGEMTDQEFRHFLAATVAHLRQNTTNGSIHYICMDWRHIAGLLDAGSAYDKFMNACVWNKQNGGMGSFYRSKHEMICVFKNGQEPHVNNIELGKHGRYRTNVWDYAGQTSFHQKRDEEMAMHPTVKPVEMVADAILDCSHRDQLVLDPFGGSGSTLIAAEKTHRRAYLIEIEPKYIDVTIQRWQRHTQQQATLLSTGESFDAVKKSRQGGAV